MAMTPEGRVKHKVKKWLDDHKVFYFMPVSNGMGQGGIPDFVCCGNGTFIGIETKAPGKRGNTTPNQDRVLAAITSAGGVSLVVDDAEQLQPLEELLNG